MTPEQALPYNELLARFLQLEQRVNDLTAQLAQHEASTLAHTSLRTLGYVVLDGLDTPDYDVTAQTDGPLLVDDALTDAQRDRIWRRVLDDATVPEYTVYRPDEVQP